MRKHVKPADAQAAIPDPVRGGDLPAEGLTVDWSVHWARLAQRGDILVTDVDADATDAVHPIEPEAADGTVASVPFMITGDMRARLQSEGLSDDEIAKLTPADAHALLSATDEPSA